MLPCWKLLQTYEGYLFIIYYYCMWIYVYLNENFNKNNLINLSHFPQSGCIIFAFSPTMCMSFSCSPSLSAQSIAIFLCVWFYSHPSISTGVWFQDLQRYHHPCVLKSLTVGAWLCMGRFNQPQIAKYFPSAVFSIFLNSQLGRVGCNFNFTSG